MNKNTFDDSVLNLSANEKLTNVNNFVFTNNQEFINFQMRFTDIVRADGNSLDLGTDCGCVDEMPKFYPSKDCEQIKLTFMYQDTPYTIINNKAFFWEGYKKVVIQGARSRHCASQDIPTIVVHNEREKDAKEYKDANGNKCYSYAHDDAIFNIQNEHSSPTNIVVSDIAFRVAFNLTDVEGANLYERWYHPDICPVFFKVYEASSFKMFNVRMYSQYLDLTHVFLHWCENVDITNCEFKNYNARKIGGNVWICQRVKNVNIVNNDFYKYGNDENIGIWGDSIMSRDENGYYNSKDTLSGLDSDAYANRQLKFEHIHIKNNRFFYGKPEYPFSLSKDKTNVEKFPDHISLRKIHDFQKEHKDYQRTDSEEEWNGVIDIFQNLYVSQHTPKTKILFPKINEGYATVDGDMGFETPQNIGGNEVVDSVVEPAIVPYVHYEVSDYVTSGNEFYIDSPMNVLMGVTFDNYCHTEGIKITNNLIKYGPWAHGECQLQDFKVVYDKNPDTKDAIYDLEMTNKKSLRPILIEDNTIESSAYPYIAHKIGEKYIACEYHIVIDVESGCVEFNRNTVTEYTESVKTLAENAVKNSTNTTASDDCGYMLLYSRDKGGSIMMRDNVFRGMSAMGSFDFTEPAEATKKGDKSAKENKSFIRLSASGNVFQGKTWFNSKNLKEGVFDFRCNKFFATCDQLILNELPERSLLTLTNNVFRRLTNAGSGSGFLYYHDATKPIGNPSLILLSSGNKFQSVSGHICEYYDGADINIYSSDEVCLDDDYYEAKSEYYEDH